MRKEARALALATLALGCGASTAGRTVAQPPTPPAAVAPAPAAPPPGPRLMSPADLDRLVEALWAEAHVAPAPAAGDAEFLRRATLDVVGRIPTLDEAEKFLADRAPGKRARLVDALLANPEYAEHWGGVLLDLFVGRQFRKPRFERALDPRAYFVTALRENRPYDRMAREMLTFSGEILPNGPGVFLASHLKGGGPEAMASATARLFLGVQIQCAQCHDHPYDTRYKQEDFYGLVAYFARTRQREEKLGKGGKEVAEPKAASPEAAPAMEAASMAPGAAASPAPAPAPAMAQAPAPAPATATAGADGMPPKRFLVFEKPNGKTRLKKAGAAQEIVVPPRFFGRDVAPLPGEASRDTLARAVVTSDLFAKTVVDRTWAQLFGRGIVEPWDDLGGERDPKHPQLLTKLADDFRAGGHDLKRLLRTLLLSRAYGLTSRGAVEGEPGHDPAAVFARAAVRRLTPEQLFRSLLVATGAERIARPDAEEIQKRIDRALKEYLFVFGDDEMAEVDTFNGNVPQALLLLNGEITNQGARARPGGTLDQVLAATPDGAARLRALFLATYARPPTGDETARLLSPRLTAGAGARAPWEDVFFALLTSTEMLTNH
jgi:hypothetical protein